MHIPKPTTERVQPLSTHSDRMEAVKKLLVAASPTIPDQVALRYLNELPSGWDGDVQFLEGNKGVRDAIKARWPDAIVAKAKGPISIKKLASEISHLILLWDGETLSRLLLEARLHRVRTKLVPVSVTRVVNKKVTDDYDVYIGRGSPWGNPYAIGHEGEGDDRQEVIRKYREFFNDKIENDPAFKTGVLALKGLRLACFCKPLACHGDVIAEYLNNIDDEHGGEDPASS